MSVLETISFKISKKLAGDLKKKAGNNQSDFIRQAIQEKLSREVKEDETLTTMVEQIKNMDPLSLHGTVADLVLTSRVIFEQIKKQNELLKIMHESASLAGTLSYEMWKEDKTEKESQEWFNAIIKDSKDEIKQIDL